MENLQKGENINTLNSEGQKTTTNSTIDLTNTTLPKNSAKIIKVLDEDDDFGDIDLDEDEDLLISEQKTPAKANIFNNPQITNKAPINEEKRTENEGKQQQQPQNEDEYVPKKIRKHFKENSLAALMFGFGDAPQPCQETVDLMEDIMMDFLRDLIMEAIKVSDRRIPYGKPIEVKGSEGKPGIKQNFDKITVQDILFVLRHDPKKYARAKEFYELQLADKKTRKELNSGNNFKEIQGSLLALGEGDKSSSSKSGGSGGNPRKKQKK